MATRFRPWVLWLANRLPSLFFEEYAEPKYYDLSVPLFGVGIDPEVDKMFREIMAQKDEYLRRLIKEHEQNVPGKPKT